MTGEVRMFKIWSCDRSLKKSTTASSLQELINKGCSKLGLDQGSQVKVVLDEDGTEVDEEDYFALLPGNSVFMFLQDNEQWTPDQKEDIRKDETDSVTGSGDLENSIASLAGRLRSDISNIITFSSEQLQQIVDCETHELAQLLGRSERYVQTIQAACQRHLDEQAQIMEVLDLFKLYHRAHQAAVSADDDSDAKAEKKRKFDNSL